MRAKVNIHTYRSIFKSRQYQAPKLTEIATGGKVKVKEELSVRLRHKPRASPVRAQRKQGNCLLRIKGTRSGKEEPGSHLKEI